MTISSLICSGKGCTSSFGGILRLLGLFLMNLQQIQLTVDRRKDTLDFFRVVFAFYKLCWMTDGTSRPKFVFRWTLRVTSFREQVVTTLTAHMFSVWAIMTKMVIIRLRTVGRTIKEVVCLWTKDGEWPSVNFCCTETRGAGLDMLVVYTHSLHFQTHFLLICTNKGPLPHANQMVLNDM